MGWFCCWWGFLSLLSGVLLIFFERGCVVICFAFAFYLFILFIYSFIHSFMGVKPNEYGIQFQALNKHLYLYLYLDCLFIQ